MSALEIVRIDPKKGILVRMKNGFEGFIPSDYLAIPEGASLRDEFFENAMFVTNDQFVVIYSMNRGKTECTLHACTTDYLAKYFGYEHTRLRSVYFDEDDPEYKERGSKYLRSLPKGQVKILVLPTWPSLYSLNTERVQGRLEGSVFVLPYRYKCFTVDLRREKLRYKLFRLDDEKTLIVHGMDAFVKPNPKDKDGDGAKKMRHTCLNSIVIDWHHDRYELVGQSGDDIYVRDRQTIFKTRYDRYAPIEIYTTSLEAFKSVFLHREHLICISVSRNEIEVVSLLSESPVRRHDFEPETVVTQCFQNEFLATHDNLREEVTKCIKFLYVSDLVDLPAKEPRVFFQYDFLKFYQDLFKDFDLEYEHTPGEEGVAYSVFPVHFQVLSANKYVVQVYGSVNVKGQQSTEERHVFVFTYDGATVHVQPISYHVNVASDLVRLKSLMRTKSNEDVFFTSNQTADDTTEHETVIWTMRKTGSEFSAILKPELKLKFKCIDHCVLNGFLYIMGNDAIRKYTLKAGIEATLAQEPTRTCYGDFSYSLLFVQLGRLFVFFRPSLSCQIIELDSNLVFKSMWYDGTFDEIEYQYADFFSFGKDIFVWLRQENYMCAVVCFNPEDDCAKFRFEHLLMKNVFFQGNWMFFNSLLKPEIIRSFSKSQNSVEDVDRNLHYICKVNLDFPANDLTAENGALVIVGRESPSDWARRISIENYSSASAD